MSRAVFGWRQLPRRSQVSVIGVAGAVLVGLGFIVVPGVVSPRERASVTHSADGSVETVLSSDGDTIRRSSRPPRPSSTWSPAEPQPLDGPDQVSTTADPTDATSAPVSSSPAAAAPGTAPGPSAPAPSAPQTTVTAAPNGPPPPAGLPPKAVIAQVKGDKADVMVRGRPMWIAGLTQSGPTTATTAATVMMVTGDPGAPNIDVALPFADGWAPATVPRDQVTITESPLRIDVALGAHRLKVWDGTTVALDVPIEIGASTSATPTGLTFTLNTAMPGYLVQPGLGNWAIPLASTNNLGRIAIHGIPPGDLGGGVSQGCVRVDDVTLRWLGTYVLAGTPVLIRP